MSQDCYFASVDIKSAYRSVHVLPRDRQYQGFVWNYEGVSTCFQDNCLCFGLRCAPFIYTQITEFVVRCMTRRGIDGVFGYLDDFLVSAPTYEECNFKLASLIRLLRSLGFWISWKKVIPPTQLITYLGIEIDSVDMEFRLPVSKLERIRSLVSKCAYRDRVSKHDLQVLAGHLAHASIVVRGGRTFSRSLINLIKTFPDTESHVSLPPWVKADLNWWSILLSVFNGSSKIIRSVGDQGYLETDASMTGFAAVYGSDWLVGSWTDQDNGPSDLGHHWSPIPIEFESDMDINLRELWPVIASARRWGSQWSGLKIRVKTDNTQVQTMINTGRSTSVRCMWWIRELFWLSFIFNFHIVSVRVSSEDNVLPDYLSRLFSRKCPNQPIFLTEALCCFQGWRFSNSGWSPIRDIGWQTQPRPPDPVSGSVT